MEDEVRCQSCAMPLEVSRDGKVLDGFYGTEADGSTNRDWCRFCYESGRFTKPDLTLAGMIELSIEHMTGSMKMPREQATALANRFIPPLKRWRKA